MNKPNFNQQLRLWTDELHAVANEGLHWEAENPYQVHRYERIRRVAAALFAAQDTRSAAEIEQLYRGELTHIAPHVGGCAAVFNQQGEILLIRRADNRLWLYVGMTNNLERRLFEHKQKLVPGFTRKYNIASLAHVEVTSDIHAALAREKQIKSWARDKKIALTEDQNPKWRDLSDD